MHTKIHIVLWQRLHHILSSIVLYLIYWFICRNSGLYWIPFIWFEIENSIVKKSSSSIVCIAIERKENKIDQTKRNISELKRCRHTYIPDTQTTRIKRVEVDRPSYWSICHRWIVVRCHPNQIKVKRIQRQHLFHHR